MPDVEGDGVLVDDLPDGLVVADAQGVVVTVNGAACRLLGCDDSAIGQPLEQVVPLTDLDGRIWWSCAKPYAGLASRVGHPERALYLPDGREVLVTSRYVREKPLAPVQRVVVSVRSARVREREDRARAELVSTAAHELRSPLTSVKGFTSTLLRRWDRFSDEQKRFMVETVEADADRLIRLISELLDTARIETGRLAVRRTPLDVCATVQRHIAGLVAAGHDESRFRVEVEDPLPELWADSDKLDQILANLLENALRHGDGVVTVRLAPCAGGGTRLSVADRGPGVDPEMRERIFTKFFRSGERGGTGLGLYIVRGLVAAHGGRISIGGAAGEGAVFSVDLPSGVPD